MAIVWHFYLKNDFNDYQLLKELEIKFLQIKLIIAVLLSSSEVQVNYNFYLTCFKHSNNYLNEFCYIFYIYCE